MDARALCERLEGGGLALTATAEGVRVEPASMLTDEARSLIRAHRGALLEWLAVRGEITALLARQCPEDHSDYPEALRIALADPGAALEALRDPAEEWGPQKRAEVRRMAELRGAS